MVIYQFAQISKGLSISGFDALFYTVAFLVPGFILNLALSIFVPQKSEQQQASFLRFLTLSCINYAFWSWLIYLVFKLEFFKQNPIYTAFVWGAIILISPTIFALLIAFFSQRDAVKRALQRLGFRTISSIPTAWDYKFSKTENPVWVIVGMKDGSEVAGLFGSNSFASSAADTQDIYIQQVFAVEENNPWQPLPGSDGILIVGDQIKYIEFLSFEGEIADG